MKKKWFMLMCLGLLVFLCYKTDISATSFRCDYSFEKDGTRCDVSFVLREDGKFVREGSCFNTSNNAKRNDVDYHGITEHVFLNAKRDGYECVMLYGGIDSEKKKAVISASPVKVFYRRGFVDTNIKTEGKGESVSFKPTVLLDIKYCHYSFHRYINGLFTNTLQSDYAVTVRILKEDSNYSVACEVMQNGDTCEIHGDVEKN